MIKFLKFPKLKLLQKFLLSYFLLIALPLVILFTYTYNTMSKIIEQNANFSTEQAFKQTYNFMNYKLFRIFDISNILATDNSIISILKNDPSNYSLAKQIEDMSNLRAFLSSFQNNEDVCNISLYVKDAFIYASENSSLYSINYIKNAKWVNLINSKNYRFLWCPSQYLESDYEKSTKFLALTKTIKNPDNFSENIGYLRVNFRKDMIEDILKKANTVNGSFTYIENSEGLVVAASDNEGVVKYKVNLATIKKLSDSDFNTSTLSMDGDKWIVMSSLLDKTDWYMVTMVPYKTILSSVTVQRTYLSLIVIAVGSLSLILAYYFSNNINKRISKVVNGMKSVHVDNLDKFIENDSTDELGELIDNYNYMINRMSLLIEEQYKYGKEVKNAELKALQAQINPHFLYNTLDMINWMSYKGLNEEIRVAVKSLAKFYKLSLNKGKAIVSLKDEINHASLYILLQNMRYDNRISLVCEIPEELMKYTIPKITLQPIIENSILHGILSKPNASGTITIKAFSENNILYLEVIDDGVGIEPSKLKEIQQGTLCSSKGSGYGLKNIDQRFKLSYGEQFGINFRSELNIGTTVQILLPAIIIDQY